MDVAQKANAAGIKKSVVTITITAELVEPVSLYKKVRLYFNLFVKYLLFLQNIIFAEYNNICYYKWALKKESLFGNFE